ncbi:hypothetical protein RF11_05703 [Thelohanellus kitauei]|uniref:Uncharacterized protein n=1 Tax=Thelohanellus kitauei TaxID=669202 RepID=A0A0C2IUI5_THEKT|nr:hypothetical protein RF11_05703 [Thelohanellus kitauei]
MLCGIMRYKHVSIALAKCDANQREITPRLNWLPIYLFMVNQNSFGIPDPDVPICKRLPKRKCVTDYEKVKSTMDVDVDILQLPIPKRTSPRAGSLGKRRGRPPSKIKPTDYVFPTAIANLFASLINEGIPPCDFIEWHKRFFSTFPFISPQTVSTAINNVKAYKEGFVKKKREAMNPNYTSTPLNALRQVPPPNWTRHHAPQNRPIVPDNYIRYSTVKRGLFEPAFRNATPTNPQVMSVPSLTSYGCSNIRPEYYYNVQSGQPRMTVNQPQRMTLPVQSNYNDHQYFFNNYPGGKPM